MKVLLFFLFFFSLLNAKVVSLSATVKYTNSTDKYIKGVYLKIHSPPETFYQKLLKVNVSGANGYTVKKHKDSNESYVDMTFDLKPKSVSVKKVEYILNIKKDDINIKEYLNDKNLKYIKYTEPSKNIESTSKQIKAISKLITRADDSLYNKLKLAYEFPSSYLDFTPMGKKSSALSALKSAKGDCTEYSYLFVALARSIGIPARETAVFAFKNKSDFKMPNHNASEIYINNYGWVPVYPNLSRGKYNNEYSLGKISDNIIVFMEEKNWTWSNYISKKNNIDFSKVSAEITWSINSK